MVDIRRATTDDERADALSVRFDVFVDEQGVPEAIEVDGKDEDAIHFVAYDDDDDRRPVGAARLRELDAETGKVERVAVVAGRRGEGLGRELMAQLEATARERGLSTLVMHAQTSVEEFYEHLGYRTTSDVFEEAGIEHVEMETSLTDR
ncbi:GNAT family N-acetyltransferase [Haloarculaceae archaeon H-GB2-1]|nr:GNAT family N-acetyltransferase [Haloarculaceae archaeon H-GB1-1]MEA5387220.1 GNAT family N-acetyltransferase [Haloarculaceae archaeon H-GB11]MEA5408715.1 GNAT family N-acetyltransferase [Haloarculaceae archaeon H-GB2-1]